MYASTPISLFGVSHLRDRQVSCHKRDSHVCHKLAKLEGTAQISDGNGVGGESGLIGNHQVQTDTSKRRRQYTSGWRAGRAGASGVQRGELLIG